MNPASNPAPASSDSAVASAPPSRVLVVDDESPMLRALGTNLRARGYQVDLAPTGEEALQLAARHRPDAVILDLGLPGISGIEVIEGLRGWTAVPIIILSARGAEHDKVAALDAGADDYVTKPFGMDELLARLRAALRRIAPAPESALVETPDFTVDLAAKKVTASVGRPTPSGATSRPQADSVTGRRVGVGPAGGGRAGLTGPEGEVRLTPTEWGLVEVLVRNAGKLVSQRQLLQDVWGPQYGEETNYLRVHMAHIRRKLEPDPSRPRYFITEPGMGYRFEGPDA
jgi:two-component system, OmpR family, KDP operon response regulator KdpE